MQLPNGNAFHLENVDRITDNNQKERHQLVVDIFTNETTATTTNDSHSVPTGPKISKGKPLSSIKPIAADKASINIDEMKVHEKKGRTSKHSVPAKPLNVRTSASHPKRESFNQPMWHKNLKDLHKSGSVNGLHQNGFNGIVDVVVVDMPPSYSRLRWDKPRTSTFTSPSLRYVPIGRSPSIFDFFMGLNSIPGNWATENAIYVQQPGLQNHRQSYYDRLVSPATILQNVMNGERIQWDENANQWSGISTDSIKNPICACGERNKLD